MVAVVKLYPRYPRSPRNLTFEMTPQPISDTKCTVRYYKWAFVWQVKSSNTERSTINEINRVCIKEYMQEE